MRKVIVIMFALFAIGAVAQAQKVRPSSNVITEQRTVMNFSQLSVTDGIEVVVLFTGTEGVEIQAPDNVVQFVDAVVVKDVLNIGFRKGFKMRGNATIRVTVNKKALTNITVTKKAKVIFGNIFTTDKLNVRVTDATLEGPIVANSAVMVLEKGAKANLTGTCKDLRLTVSGASSLGSTAFTAEVVDANLRGKSTARLTIAQSVQFRGAGESTLRYSGSPRIQGVKADKTSGLIAD